MRINKKNTIPVLTGFIMVGSLTTLPVVTSCANNVICTITFTATVGTIVGNKYISVNKGIKWEAIKSRPTVKVEEGSAHQFTNWSIDGLSPIPEDYVFEANTTIKALYSGTHQMDGYKIIDHKLYKACKVCGQLEQLSQSELEGFNNKFFIEKADGSLVLSSKTVNEEMADVPDGGTLKIHLMCTDEPGYVIELGQLHNATKTLEVNGLVNYENNSLTNIKCYKGGQTESYQGQFENRGYYLSFNNCKMIGKPGISNAWLAGFLCSNLICKNCHFIGEQCLACGAVEREDQGALFENCTFDARDTRPEATSLEYSIYCSNIRGTFNNCSFISWGKAIKVYGTGGGKNRCYFNFNNCNFDFEYNAQKSGTSIKAAIEIDSSQVEHYDVHIKGTTIKVNTASAGLTPNGYNSRYHDSANPSKCTVIDDGDNN